MKKLLLFALLACTLPSKLAAQGAFTPLQTATKSVNGVLAPFPGATITVCAAGAIGAPCSPALANTIFSDTALTQPKPNPFTADSGGNYQFTAASGTYTVTVSGTGTPGYSYQVTLTTAVGSGVPSGQVAFGCGGGALCGNGNFLWNSLSNVFTIQSLSGANSFNLSNPTVATSLNNFSPPTMSFLGNYWTGSASSLDTWTLGVTLAAGSNPISTFSISNLNPFSVLSITSDQIVLNGIVSNGSNPALCWKGTTSGQVCLTVGAAAGSPNANVFPSTNPTGVMALFGTGGGNPTPWTWQAAPIIYAPGFVDLTGQNAAIGTTAIGSTTAMGGQGLFQAEWNAKITTAAGVSSTLGPLTITYTHTDGTVQTVTCPAFSTAGTVETSDTGNTTNTGLYGIPCTFFAKAATNISYAFGYASNAANAMVYELHLHLERVQN